jgi:hypothetical protein
MLWEKIVLMRALWTLLGLENQEEMIKEFPREPLV